MKTRRDFLAGFGTAGGAIVAVSAGVVAEAAEAGAIYEVGLEDSYIILHDDDGDVVLITANDETRMRIAQWLTNEQPLLKVEGVLWWIRRVNMSPTTVKITIRDRYVEEKI